MSKKEDDDKVKVCQCEKKSMVVQGIKDRSEIRRHEVSEKQGCGGEGETREARKGKQGKNSETGVREIKERSRGDPGKIHGSRGFGVQECRRKYRRGGKEGRCQCRG